LTSTKYAEKTKVPVEKSKGDRKHFEQMRYALLRIKSYSTPKQLRKDSQIYGLDYEEALEMAYENVLQEAKAGLKGIRKGGE
jgi:hypothetical protein